MSEFSVLINDQDDIPVGLLMVHLINHEYLKYENGKPVLEWIVNSFPMKFQWLKQFGNLENQLNRYIYKEIIDSKLSPDVIVNPVDEENAIALTRNFSRKLTKVNSQWNELAVKWPKYFISIAENKEIYLNILIQQFQNLYKSFQNKTHYNMAENSFQTIAWDIAIKKILFDNHIDYFENFSDNNQSKIDESNENKLSNNFINYDEIIKNSPLYDSQFNLERKIHNLSEILEKIICVYEISEQYFLKEVRIDYSYRMELARYLYIPIDATRIDSGIYMLLEGNETRHIYIILEDNTIEEFLESIRQATGAIAEEDD
jgi:hypothetical protein